MTARTKVAQMMGRRAVLGSVVALILLVLGYGGLAVALAGRVPSNVTVEGIAIGGMSPAQARVTLERAFAGRALKPVQLTAASRTAAIQPAAAGLEIDTGATVAGLTHFTVNPVSLWSHLTAQGSQPFKLRVDRGKLTAAVTKAASTLDRPVKEGSIGFAGTKATVVRSVAGSEVQVPQTLDAVVSAWPHQLVVPAATKRTQPKVSAAEIASARKEFAVPAMSAPVKVLAGRATVTLAPRQYARALSTTLDGKGRLHLKVDTPTVLAAIRSAAPGLESPPVDAQVRLVAGQPQIEPAVAGTKFDQRAVSAKFAAALTSRSRSLSIRLLPASAKVSTSTARAWKVQHAISSFTTEFPVNPTRTNNIKIAVATLNRTFIRPGGQFSLNSALGERTPAKGYKKAPVIFDGRLENDYGGGVSQVSTTTFNAAFFAGVRIDQHTPHSFYIARYPEGREATVSWPEVDQKWTNDTGSGILIQAYVQGNSLTVTLWGTKRWDVEAVKGPRRKVVKPKNIVDDRPGCVPQLPTPGFDVTVTQVFTKDGAQVKRVPFNTHYIPEDNVKCTHPSVP